MQKTSKGYLPQQINGEIFCYLPLSLQTGLPVHVSANFAVLNDRTGIHASDSYCLSEEVEWNRQIMQSVIPKAYCSLLLAIKHLCISDYVSVSEYEFYSLWPLKENLKSHNPWDKMIRHLYYQLSKSELFYSTCTVQWLKLSDAYILDESVLSQPYCEDKSPTDSLIGVFEELSYCLVKLPYSYQQHITESEISERIVHEKQFLDIFFNNTGSISTETRNEVLFLTLKVYATNSSRYIHDLLHECECIPCTPNGILLKKCSEVIDPCSYFSELYDDNEGAFPISDFHSDSLVHFALSKLSIIKDLLPWKNILERAATIKLLHSTCLLYTSPSPRDATLSRMPSSA